jgi:hypothetical protein
MSIKINNGDLIPHDELLLVANTVPASPSGSVAVSWSQDHDVVGSDTIHYASAYVLASAMANELNGDGNLSHDNLTATSLVWADSGHTGQASSVASFNASGEAVSLAYDVIAEKVEEFIELEDLTGCGWNAAPITGLPEHFAGFGAGVGTAATTQFSAQEAADLIVDHLDETKISAKTSAMVSAMIGAAVAPGGIINDAQNARLVDLEAVVAIPLVRPVFDAASGVEYLAVTATASATLTLVQDKIIYCLHVEETVDAHYAALTATVSAVNTNGCELRYAIYSQDPETGRPGDLLWFSGVISPNITGLKTVAFADGTITQAGVDAGLFDDDDDSLRPPLGLGFYRAIWFGGPGATTVGIRGISESRVLGRPLDGNLASYTAYQESAQFTNTAPPTPVFPAVANGLSYSSLVPYFPLSLV